MIRPTKVMAISILMMVFGVVLLCASWWWWPLFIFGPLCSIAGGCLLLLAGAWELWRKK